MAPASSALKRPGLYAQRIAGRFRRLHRSSGFVLLLILLVTPWISFHGKRLLLMDIPGRRLHVLASVFTPRDMFFLVLILFGLAFSLFFFTTLFGRIWCGFACPQTVLLEELIRPIERRIEGGRSRRLARDRAGWTFDRAWRKVVKWVAFTVISGVIAFTFISYFVPAPLLWSGQAGLVSYGFVAAIGGSLLFDLGFFREQFCIYFCPYARIQGALTDDESLVVAYDPGRGEPRGKVRRQQPPGQDGRGWCIDCNKCVVVCPQGIDIRHGYQMECISCALCIDACESVMGRFQQETLVRYATVANAGADRVRWLRPRTIGYGALLLIVLSAFLVGLASRGDIEATVNRLPGTLFAVDEDGWVRNTFLLQLTNKRTGDDVAERFEVRVDGLPGAEVTVPEIELRPEETRQVPLVVRVRPTAELPRTVTLTVHVTSPGDEIAVETTFKSGGAEG